MNTTWFMWFMWFFLFFMVILVSKKSGIGECNNDLKTKNKIENQVAVDADLFLDNALQKGTEHEQYGIFNVTTNRFLSDSSGNLFIFKNLEVAKAQARISEDRHFNFGNLRVRKFTLK